MPRTSGTHILSPFGANVAESGSSARSGRAPGARTGLLWRLLRHGETGVGAGSIRAVGGRPQRACRAPERARPLIVRREAPRSLGETPGSVLEAGARASPIAEDADLRCDGGPRPAPVLVAAACDRSDIRRVASRRRARLRAPMLSDRFRAAVEEGNVDQVPELFHEHAAFRSPVLFRPYEGRDQVLKVLRAAEQVLGIGGRFRYVHQLEDPHDRVAILESEPRSTERMSRGSTSSPSTRTA